MLDLGQWPCVEWVGRIKLVSSARMKTRPGHEAPLLLSWWRSQTPPCGSERRKQHGDRSGGIPPARPALSRMYQIDNAIMMDIMLVKTTQPAIMRIVITVVTVMIQAVQMIKSILTNIVMDIPLVIRRSGIH